MTQASDTSGEDRLRSRLEALANDPESYADFTDDLTDLTGSDEAKLAALEAELSTSFDAALDDVMLLQQRESLSSETTVLLRRFASPALLIRADGQIVSRNDSAMQILASGANIRDLPFELPQAEPLAPLVDRIAKEGAGNQPMVLRRAHLNDTERVVTLVMMRTQIGADRAPGCMMFVIDPVTSAQAIGMMSRAYGLTEAEGEILRAFGDGQSLQQISEHRGRAIATIRTQFQRLLEKTGTGTQSELMRTIQALSHFVHDIGDVAETATHGTRRRLDVLRPGGRSVDVLMSGDHGGQVVVFMTGAFLYSFAPKIEAVFRDAGLCVVAIGRPGFGRTSLAPRGEDIADCVAGDIRAVLSQLGLTSAPVLVHSTGIPTTLRVAERHPDLVERIVIIGGMAPPDYMRAHARKSSSMAMSLLAAAGTSRRLLRLLLSGRHRMYMRLGARRFLFRQYAKAPVDQGFAIRPDLLKEYENAVNFLMAQGYDPGTEELLDSQKRWGDLGSYPVPVEILHGRLDPLCPLPAMQAWVADNADALTLRILDDAGHYSLAAETDAVIDRLKASD